MEVQFVDGTAVEDALKELRSPETSDTDWVAITYDNAKTMKMRLLGKGNGGADEMRGVLENTLAVFGMVRLIDRVDNSDTVKFCRVFFLGEKVPRMLKAKISVHQAAVKELLGQSHVDYECSTPEELTSDIVFEKVTVVSGTSSRVLDQKGGKPLGHAGQQVTTGSVPKTGPKREEIDTDTLFENEAEAREMLQDVRDDSTETTYAIYEFDGKHLVPKTSGVGAVDDVVLPILQEVHDKALYVLLRKMSRYEITDNVRFAHITWVPPQMPFMQKARLNAYSSRIDEFFSPYHVLLHAEVPSDISDAIVDAAIEKASGTADYVLDTVVEDPRKPDFTPKKAPEPEAEDKPKPVKKVVVQKKPKEEAPKDQDGQKKKDGLVLEDEEEFQEAMRQLRGDDPEVDWFAFGMSKPKAPAKMLGKGAGFDSMKAVLRDDTVAWIMLRRHLQIDDSDTVKFVFVQWLPDHLNVMLKARIGTYADDVANLVGQYHTDITNPTELTEEMIQDAIAFASGQKVHVLS